MRLLSPELLAECRAQLDAWSDDRRARMLPRSQQQRRRRDARPCSCGCGGVEWNRAGVCQAEYARRRRRRLSHHRRAGIKREADGTPKSHRQLCKFCRSGRVVVSMRRCRKCYHAYRRKNPKRCDCGNYYRAKGTRCPRCCARRQIELYARTFGRCACGRKVRFATGECVACRQARHERTGVDDRGRPIARCCEDHCDKAVWGRDRCHEHFIAWDHQTPEGRISRRVRWLRQHKRRVERERLAKQRRQPYVEQVSISTPYAEDADASQNRPDRRARR